MFLFSCLLLKEAVSVPLIYFFMAMAGGFLFSRFFLEKKVPYLNLILGFGVAAVLIWLFVTIANSNLGYQETVITEIKGAFLLSIVFSFGASEGKFISFIQVLSLILLMSSAIFIKTYNTVQYTTIFFYLLCWAAVSRLKFYQNFNIPPGMEMIKNHLALIFILIGLATATLFFFNFPLKQAISTGFFHEDKPLLNDLENKYNELQNKVLKIVPDSLLKVGYNQDVSSAPLFLSDLIKESEAIMETAKAELALISLLRTAGMGIEQREGQQKEAILLLEEFVKTKAMLNFKKIKSKINQMFKEDVFLDFKERKDASDTMNKMEDSNSPEEAKKQGQQLDKIIKNSNFEPQEKQKVEKLAAELQACKLFELRGEEASPMAKKMQESPAAASGGQLEKKENSEEKPETAKEITVAQAMESPAASLPQTQEATANFSSSEPQKATFNFRILLLLFYLLAIALVVTWIILYFMTVKQKEKLLSLYDINPAAFIVSLYFNMKGILTILGSDCKNTVVPLRLAEVVDNKYQIQDSLFLKFSLKFEEARYSQHSFEEKDSELILAEYNGLLDKILNTGGMFSVLYTYCAALIRTRPIFIRKEKTR